MDGKNQFLPNNIPNPDLIFRRGRGYKYMFQGGGEGLGEYVTIYSSCFMLINTNER